MGCACSVPLCCGDGRAIRFDAHWRQTRERAAKMTEKATAMFSFSPGQNITEIALEETLRKFEQFDTNRNSYIDQSELDGLKKLFSLEELDVGVVDGKVSRAEFVAAVHKVPYSLAKSLVDAHLDKQALAMRLLSEVDDAMKKFNTFDKDGNGFIEAHEMDGLKKLFQMSEVDVIEVDGKIDRVEFFSALMKCSPAAAQAAVQKWTFRQKLSDNLDAAMQKFAAFDKDDSGWIEANELNGLKKLFTIDEIDVGVKDGRIGRAEFFAALYGGYPADAQAVIDARMEQLTA